MNRPRKRLAAASRSIAPIAGASRWVIELGDAQQQRRRDHEIHGGASERDQQLLIGLVRHFVEVGDAADRQEGDLLRDDAEPPRDEDMAEFMQHDADENRHDEQHAVARGDGSAVLIGGKSNPGDMLNPTLAYFNVLGNADTSRAESRNAARSRRHRHCFATIDNLRWCKLPRIRLRIGTFVLNGRLVRSQDASCGRDRHDRALRILRDPDPGDGLNDSLFFAPVSRDRPIGRRRLKQPSLP